MPSDAYVLGFDTSAAHCAAALICGNRVLSSRREEMARGQAEKLMPLLEDVLTEGNVAWGDLDCIGVGVGPGNFTGIRIAVAAARGIAVGLGCKAIGVTSFEALALDTSDATATPILTAPRDQLYVGPEGDTPARVVPMREALEVLQQRTAISTDALPGLNALGIETVRPAHPIAEAIARVARDKREQNVPRPAPLYLRPADAAPSREPAPVILP